MRAVAGQVWAVSVAAAVVECCFSVKADVSGSPLDGRLTVAVDDGRERRSRLLVFA